MIANTLLHGPPDLDGGGEIAGGRLRVAVASTGAAVLGAAPHVLHHVGPFAGGALVAGATGKAVFGALALFFSLPMLRKLRRRSGSWLLPAIALVSMTAVFLLSSLLVQPVFNGSEEETAAPAPTAPADPAKSGTEHEQHHR